MPELPVANTIFAATPNIPNTGDIPTVTNLDFTHLIGKYIQPGTYYDTSIARTRYFYRTEPLPINIDNYLSLVKVAILVDAEREKHGWIMNGVLKDLGHYYDWDRT